MQTDIPEKKRIVNLRERTLDVLYTLAIGLRFVFWYITRPTKLGVRVLVVRDEEILLVRHRSGSEPWSIPGGGVKAGESLEAAAHREVLEEAGCPIQLERLHGIFHNFSQGYNNHIAVFIGKPLADPRQPVGNLEIAEARYVHLHALLETTDVGSRGRITEYLRGETGVTGTW